MKKLYLGCRARIFLPRAKFAEAGIDDPTVHFNGKTIRVHGVVIRKEKGSYIDVNDVSQIELVK